MSGLAPDRGGPETLRLAEVEVEAQIARLVPEEVARRRLLVPVRLHGGNLEVAMAAPSDLEAIEEVRYLTGFPVRALAGSLPEIEEVIRRSFGLEHEARQTVVDLRFESLRQSPGIDGPGGAGAASGDDEEAPMARLLSSILGGAIEGRASDIHIEPQRTETLVRYRTDGVLHEVMTVPSQVQQALVSRIKLLANLDIAEHRRPQDGHLSFAHRGRAVDLRISTLLGTCGEKIVLRVLDEGSLAFDLGDLGLAGRDLALAEELLAMPFGMVLSTGPTGSGKTTTLYALLRRLEPAVRNIITLEDPVEYRLHQVHQVQVGVPSEVTFARGLRAILRQDPEVIMVGEIRDQETAEIAIQSAQTGHLLLSTLHTNDASGALTRLVDMGVPPFMVASALGGVIAQRLIRTVCPDCMVEHPATERELAFLGDHGRPRLVLRHGTGCSFCRGTGYRGRTGIFEILKTTEPIVEALVRGASAGEIRTRGLAEGMTTLEQGAAAAVLAGRSTVEEVRRVLGVAARA